MKTSRSTRKRTQATLNLVALMDIFTILVFFLMVNSGEMQLKLDIEQVNLAKSETETKLEENLSITLTTDDVYIADKKIMSIQQLKNDSNYTIQPIINHLKSLKPTVFTSTDQAPLPIIIYSDTSIHYSLLKKIFQTCAATPYRKIMLGVQDKSV
ncbi:MAG: biopolymer transporter ExbD [Pseudomonadota bacterium]